MKKNLQVVILAGGLGSRLEEETVVTPKPMVVIGQYPILIHIMKIYSHFGFNNFIICLGYKGHTIKDYFANYFLYNSDVTFDFCGKKNRLTIHSKKVQPWKVTLVDTGLNTQTGGRIKKIKPFIKNHTFLLTYGDGVSDINIKKLVDFHFSHGKIATVTAVKPPGKFGVLSLNKRSRVRLFSEKPAGDGGWISGGFFVLNTRIFDYLKNKDNQTPWEGKPLEEISLAGELMAYRHSGFWKCMDTLRDKRELENLWNSGNPPWKIWSKDKR
jgi:glucose-1-phosphate cytidylyltransferase